MKSVTSVVVVFSPRPLIERHMIEGVSPGCNRDLRTVSHVTFYVVLCQSGCGVDECRRIVPSVHADYYSMVSWRNLLWWD